MPDILGFDISANNEGHTIQWDQVPTDSVRFVMIKATEGATYEDPWFDRHWTAASSRGLVVGAYHFYRSNRPGQAQADNIQRVILNDANFGPGDLPVVIDVEELAAVNIKDKTSVAAYLKELDTCVQAVTAAQGTKPIIYTASYVWQTLGYPNNYLDCPLWIANPSAAPAPTLPKPFTEWSIWQYSFKGALQGVTGDLDLDRFNGSEDDFQALLLT